MPKVKWVGAMQKTRVDQLVRPVHWFGPHPVCRDSEAELGTSKLDMSELGASELGANGWFGVLLDLVSGSASVHIVKRLASVWSLCAVLVCGLGVWPQCAVVQSVRLNCCAVRQFWVQNKSSR